MNPGLTIKIYGFYMLLLGLGLFFLPNLLISIFGLPETREVWIRVLGLLSAVASLYYFQAAKYQLKPFFKVSILGRLIFAAGLVALVLFQIAPVVILLFALVEGCGALCTLWALKND